MEEEHSDGYKHFVELHTPQLLHFDVPSHLWPLLYKKLSAGTFDLEDSFSLAQVSRGAKAVVATQDIGTDAIWPVQHLIRAPRGPDLIHALKLDPGLLLRVAAALQVDSYESDEEDVGGDQHTVDIYAPLFASVLKQLHRSVFMYEVPKELRDTTTPEPTSNRMRYIPEPLAAHMALAGKANLNIQITPFFWLYPSPDDPGRVAAVEQMCIAWSVVPIMCGAPAMRNKLPLGLADYSNPEFWREAYRGEVEMEEWYCDGTAEYLSVLQKLWHPRPNREDSPRPSTPRILLPGCGNSTLGIALWRAGFTNIVQVDLVQEVVEQMQAHFPPKEYPGLIWMQGDVTSLSSFPDGSFDFVLDKATLDALLTAGAESATRWRGPTAGSAAAVTRDSAARLREGQSLSTEVAAMQGGTVGCVPEQQAEGIDKAAVTDKLGGLDLSTRYLLEMQRVMKQRGRFVIMSLRLPSRFAAVLGAAAPDLRWLIEDQLSLPACSAYLYTCSLK
uniref:Methyltransferase type 11 domain-containing protein n=1 Tax=Dunaliella tertiolecta TaxID=3047 RepID=A0A7S3QS30_DUNTE|eukprot:CAMPEP_0202339998 /NCGR_PEP_ID=MMETSP1126-20121109/1620_1 /ASSEMBLY_ACC=CAM_ASM_000457 /TAXON_ID=3047 /ORGANISM="Dunaliella tertiolecta, Strain CCMP1320" /LENGTH=500 /DNA_ID=CAMNT_0048930629 /DNA_START=24 /DNA_END=1526 /DNA_ORIENTATION=+